MESIQHMNVFRYAMKAHMDIRTAKYVNRHVQVNTRTKTGT